MPVPVIVAGAMAVEWIVATAVGATVAAGTAYAVSQGSNRSAVGGITSVLDAPGKRRDKEARLARKLRADHNMTKTAARKQAQAILDEEVTDLQYMVRRLEALQPENKNKKLDEYVKTDPSNDESKLGKLERKLDELLGKKNQDAQAS